MTTTNDATVFEHVIGADGRVRIRLASVELRLRGSTGDRVIVRTPDGRPAPDRVVFERVEGGLTIREKEVFGLTFAIGRRTVQLDIDLPADADLGIDTASGSVVTEGLRGPQQLKTASGDVLLRNAMGAIELSAVSGDATIELAGAATLTARSVSGDLVVRGGRIDALRVATTSGDIRLDSELAGDSDHAIETLSGDVELVAGSGLRVDARTVSGDLMSDLPHRTEGSMGRRALIVGDGATHLAFRSVSGDLRIRERAGSTSRRPSSPSLPAMPQMPAMPVMPTPPTPPRAPSLPPDPGRSPFVESDIEPDPAEDQRMAILRALERGELDVATAAERLAALDEADGIAATGTPPAGTDPAIGADGADAPTTADATHG